MAESYQDLVRRHARHIRWLADHPQHRSADPQIRALAAAIARDIRHRADALGRGDNLRRLDEDEKGLHTLENLGREVSGDNVISFPGARR
jgi:hypothetical protein